VGFVVGRSGAGQVFSEFFGFPCNRRSLHQLLHSHPHVSSGENVQYANVWPQYWDLYEPRGPAKGPNGG
jgi:hypothetical protein